MGKSTYHAARDRALIPTTIHIPERLKELAIAQAERDGTNLTKLVLRALAEHLGKPELAIVPRKRRQKPVVQEK